MKRLLLAIALVGCSRSDASKHETPQPQPAAQPATQQAPKHHEDRDDRAEAAPALKLDVKIDGVTSTWQQDVFDKAPHFVSANKQGEARDAWSLRELAHTLVGPNARVVAVIGDKREAIDAAAWADASKTPFVHRTRRGWLKFRWADKDGNWSEADVKDVTGVEIVRYSAVTRRGI